jgi:hypothetical protein
MYVLDMHIYISGSIVSIRAMLPAGMFVYIYVYMYMYIYVYIYIYIY